MTDLRPCPFCGSNASIKYWDDDKDDDCTVICDKFSCPGFDYWSDKQDTIKKWNTRPIEDAQAAEIERLRAALDDARVDIELGIPRVAIANIEKALKGDKPESYKSTRGVLPWKDGDEPAEDTIRRLRGGE